MTTVPIAPNRDERILDENGLMTFRFARFVELLAQGQSGEEGGVTDAANIGVGAGVFSALNGSVLEFKSLVEGSNITITESGANLTISSSGGGGGGVDGAANVGSGEGVFKTLSGTTLQFKSLIAGTNITLTDNGDDITIDAAGGGGSLGALSDVTLTAPATGSVLYKSGTDWLNTPAITIDPAASVDFFYNATLAFQSTVSGMRILPSTEAGDATIRFQDASGDTCYIEKSNAFNIGVLYNEHNGHGWVIQADNAGGTGVNMAAFDPDSECDFYYNGALAFGTQAQGASVYDSSGSSDPFLDWRNAKGSVELATMGVFNNDLFIQNSGTGAGADTFLRANNGNVTGVVIRQSGAADLFHVTTLAASTKSGGFLIAAELEIDGALNHDGANVGFYGTAPIVKQLAVAVTAAGVHAALVNLGLIT